MSKPTATIAMGSATTPDDGKPKTSGMAIVSLVCGIVGIFFFGILLGPLAIMFGAMAINQINEKPHGVEGRCIAKTGIICGIVAIVVWVVFIIIFAGGCSKLAH